MKNLDTLKTLFDKFVQDGSLLDFYAEDSENFVILYENKKNPCTPYIVHHINDGGLYWGHYEPDEQDARMGFENMKHGFPYNYCN